MWFFIICFITICFISVLDLRNISLSCLKIPAIFVRAFIVLDELIIIFSSSAIELYIFLASSLLIVSLTMSSTNFSALFNVIFLLSILVLNTLYLASVIIFCVSSNLFYVTFTYDGNINRFDRCG